MQAFWPPGMLSLAYSIASKQDDDDFFNEIAIFLSFETINNVNMIWVTEVGLAIVPGCWGQGMQFGHPECYPLLAL